MTDSEIQIREQQDQASRDLNDIMTLRDTAAFTGYFMRRLKQKQTEIEKSLKYDPPSKVDKDARESLRLNNIFAESILKMLDEDEVTAQRQINLRRS